MTSVFYTSKVDYIPSVMQSIDRQADWQIDYVSYTENIRRLMMLAYPDILLFDIDEIEQSEVQHTIQYLKKEMNGLRIIILTAPIEDQTFLHLMEESVDSILEKNESTHTHIISTIRKAREGHFIMPAQKNPPFLARLEELKTSNLDLFYRRLYDYNIDLSKREVEVAYLMKQGLRNGPIAEKLKLSEGTIKVHVNHIYKKFPVKGRRNVVELLNEIMMNQQVKGLT